MARKQTLHKVGAHHIGPESKKEESEKKESKKEESEKEESEKKRHMSTVMNLSGSTHQTVQGSLSQSAHELGCGGSL